MKTFAQLGVQARIIDALRAQNITEPTLFQASALPVLLKESGDFIGHSPTGTGKTLAFVIPLLQRVNTDTGKVQALVLCPTRELCLQNAKVFSQMGFEDVTVETAKGGESLKPQIHRLSHGVQVLVATPGRLNDLLERSVLDLSTLEYLVLDEADEMLSRGFRNDLEKILSFPNKKYMTWLFSATFPEDVRSLVKRFLSKAFGEIKKEESPKAESIKLEHHYIEVEAENKLDVLLFLLGEKKAGEQGIIFCKTKAGVQKLYKQLTTHGLQVSSLHGDLTQVQRERSLAQFAEKKAQFLISTDVAARGIDIPSLAFVIQYHLPDTLEFYVHRSGRTARAGKEGSSLTFVLKEELAKLNEYKKTVKERFVKLPCPSEAELDLSRLYFWAKGLANAPKTAPLAKEELRMQIHQLFAKTSKEELIDSLVFRFLTQNKEL